MKKTIISTAIFLLAGFTAVKANDDNGLSTEISKSFNKEFVDAKNVNWQKKDMYTIASFTFNNQVLSAYYSANGQLNTVVHHILSTDLPVMLLAQLKNYNGYWISELYEAVSNGHSSYYATIENADRTIKMKSAFARNWDMIQTTNKNL